MSFNLSSKAYGLLIIAALAWGGNAVAGKLALGHVSPMVLTFLRWSIATGLIFAVSLPQLKRDWPVIKTRLAYFLMLGAVGYTLFNATLYTALRYTSAINVTVIQAGIPMIIFALNFALFRTAVASGQIAGFLLTITGVALLAAHGDLRTLAALSINAGDALMLLAVLAYAVYTVILRWKPPVGWQSMMAVPAAGALLSSVPLLVWEVGQDAALWPDLRGWAIVLYTAVFASLTAQSLFIKGVEYIGANRAGLFINLVPVFGTLLSVAILGETLHTYQLAALLLALVGIAVAERKTKPSVPRD